MNSLITNYAREIKVNGQLTRQYMLNHDDAKRAAQEIVKTHTKYNTAQGMDNFEDTWNHFDVNKDGLVEVTRMPQFFRYMLGNALDIDLQ